MKQFLLILLFLNHVCRYSLEVHKCLSSISAFRAHKCVIIALIFVPDNIFFEEYREIPILSNLP